MASTYQLLEILLILKLSVFVYQAYLSSSRFGYLFRVFQEHRVVSISNLDLLTDTNSVTIIRIISHTYTILSNQYY